MRHALESLAVAAPDWLRAHAEPDWAERYGHRALDDRLAKTAARREERARWLRPHPVGTYDSPVRLKKPAGRRPAGNLCRLYRLAACLDWAEPAVPHDVEVPAPERAVELLAGIG